MSKSSLSSRNGSGAPTQRFPRAVVHKKILDEARTSPNASIPEIATTVGGASTDLVERVLEDYGDPAKANDGPGLQDASTELEADTAATQSDSSVDEDQPSEHTPDLEEFTDAQRRTLRAIHEQPEATLSEIAAELDESVVTVTECISEIDGFDWNERRVYVDQMFDGSRETNGKKTNEETPNGGSGTGEDTAADPVVQIRDIEERIDSLEKRLSERSASARPTFSEPELSAKVIHACLASDEITEEEELTILSTVMTRSTA